MSALTGADVLLKGLDQLIASAPQALAAAIYQEAEAIMADSKANYVPVRDGILKGSGFVAEPVIDGNTISVELGYGGAAAAYALAVHEHMDIGSVSINQETGEEGLSNADPPSWKLAEARGHGVHFTVGGPKYLERPFLEAVNGLEERLAERLEPLLGGPA